MAKKRDEDLAGREPCVGLPVQYHEGDEPHAGLLQRRGLTDPSLWDVLVFLPGCEVPVVRSALPWSELPRPGHWNYLPGW